MERVPAAHKRCGRCGRLRPLDDFFRDRSRPDGRYPTCKPCRKEYDEARKAAKAAYDREYRAKHADRLREYDRARSVRRKEWKADYDRKYRGSNKAKIVRRQREWYLKNKDRVDEYLREQRRKTAARKAEYDKRYLRENRQKVYAHNRNRQNRLNGNGGQHTDRDILDKLAFYGYRCLYCGANLSDGLFHVDHMWPVVRGGSNSWENIAVACRGCNKSKYTKTAGEYIASLASWWLASHGPH